jgi:hypothetical protein
MRRSHYLVFILLLIAQTSFGQIYQNMAQPGYKFSRARFDSVLTIPSGLGNLKNITGGQDTGQIRFNKSDSSVYVWNGRAWIKAGGGTIPTLTQVLESAVGANEAGANQIKDLSAGTSQNDAATFGQLTDTANLRLRISDTATMLAPYSKVKSIGLSMPSAFTVTNSPLTSNGTLAVTGAGTAAQYVRGDGQLATLPNGSSGGSSVAYYLNGSVAASVGTYFQMSKIPVLGVGTDFSKAGNGLISQFLTDVADPNRLEIPAGNWNFEMYFSASSSGGTPAFYVELLKYDGTTFTSIASSSVNPEAITSGTIIDLYLTSLAIPQTTLLATDRLAIRVYIVNSTGGRTITMHTENSHLCEIITNFAGGIAALNGLTANTQYLATGTSGTDFAISSLTDTHTFNLPTASATNRGALSSADWSTFNGKTTVSSYGKNAGGDSTILVLSNGTRYAAKDSVGGGGASGSTDSTFIDVKNYFTGGVTLATSTKQQRTDAWQAAIAAAQTGKYGIKFSGTWDLPTDSIIVTDRLSIVGIGSGSALTTTDNSGTLLTVNAPVPRSYYNVVFPITKPFNAENFTLQYRGAANPTNTSRGLKISVDTSISFLNKLTNLTIDSFYVGVQFHNVANSNINKCYFRNNRAFGFLNTNNETQDYGKLMMHENIFTSILSLGGEPDSTAHVKIEGGAGFDISYNDFYGSADYAVWTFLKNTTEFFPALASTEYYFKGNKVLFVLDYAFLFQSNFGTGAVGTAVNGNRIQNVQIQHNNTGFNGLVKTKGGSGSMYDFQITDNLNETPYGGAAHSAAGFVNPIYLDGSAMTNVAINDNDFVGIAFLSTNLVQKAILVTGTISGKVNALGNQYTNYTVTSDIQELVQNNLGIGRQPVVTLDVTGTGNVYGRFTRPNNANDNGVIFTPNGALSSSNPQFFMGTSAGTSYYTFQRFDGTTATNVLNIASATNNVGIGVTAPTARLHIAAGTATASTAPLKFTSGTKLTTPEAGAIEYVTGKFVIQNDGITFGATAGNASAKLEVQSTTQGVLFPRMTTVQKLAIGTPAAGLQVYDTTLNQMSYYNGTTWVNF